MAECGCGEEMTPANLGKTPAPLEWLPTGLQFESFLRGRNLWRLALPIPLVLKQDGTVLGFGRNTVGQVGQSSGTSYAKLPTPISGLSDIRLISAGTDSSFAIDQAGQLRSWGYNAYGELLLGYASPSSSPAVYGPTPSPIATNVFNVAGGGYSSLAVGRRE